MQPACHVKCFLPSLHSHGPWGLAATDGIKPGGVFLSCLCHFPSILGAGVSLKTCVALIPVGPQVNPGLLTFPDMDTDRKVGGASRAPELEPTERLGGVWGPGTERLIL